MLSTVLSSFHPTVIPSGPEAEGGTSPQFKEALPLPLRCQPCTCLRWPDSNYFLLKFCALGSCLSYKSPGPLQGSMVVSFS